jgi:hypothetical protein
MYKEKKSTPVPIGILTNASLFLHTGKDIHSLAKNTAPQIPRSFHLAFLFNEAVYKVTLDSHPAGKQAKNQGLHRQTGLHAARRSGHDMFWVGDRLKVKGAN